MKLENIPTNAVKAVIQKGEKILLLQRSLILRGENNWDLPGGLIEAGEKPELALAREVLEELFVNIRIINKSESWYFCRKKDDKVVNVYNYLCEIIDKPIKIILSEEHEQYQWVNISDIRKFAVKDLSFYDAVESLV